MGLELDTGFSLADWLAQAEKARDDLNAEKASLCDRLDEVDQALAEINRALNSQPEKKKRPRKAAAKTPRISSYFKKHPQLAKAAAIQGAVEELGVSEGEALLAWIRYEKKGLSK